MRSRNGSEFWGDGRNQGRAASMLVTAAEIASTGGMGDDTPMEETHGELQQVEEIDKHEREENINMLCVNVTAREANGGKRRLF